MIFTMPPVNSVLQTKSIVDAKLMNFNTLDMILIISYDFYRRACARTKFISREKVQNEVIEK